MTRLMSFVRAQSLLLLAAFACDTGNGTPDGPAVVVGSGGSAAGAGAAGGSSGTSPTDGGGEGGSPDHPDVPGPPCNTWEALCARRYDEVSFPVTHAAMASSASFWDYPAQTRGLRTQLDESIRGLMLEVHAYDGELALCFHDCDEGRSRLATELGHVRGFFEDNPREVVTLLVDNRVPASEVALTVEEAGLLPYLYAAEAGEPWPTLGQMIEGGTRLVVFLSDADDAPPGYRALWDEVAGTSDRAEAARDLDCDVAYGSADAPLLLVHQTLVTSDGGGAGGEGGSDGSTTGRPSAALAETVNRDPFLSERLVLCASSFGRDPTFVAVDFYDQSDVIAATQRLDGLIP